MTAHDIIAETDEYTVISEYTPIKDREGTYQTEAELEAEFIRMLTEQGYTHLPIHSERDLITNLRTQLEALNHYKFSNNEWDKFLRDKIARPNEKLEARAKRIQEDYIQPLIRDDGMTQNIMLIDKGNIHNNILQVINQYKAKSSRYDVTILINGLPLVHIELKRRGVALREAFNQINRYNHDSFLAGAGLFMYVQIFVISNGTETKYYSNTTRSKAVDEYGKPKEEGNSSYEFTSYWADAKNKNIPDLIDFTRTFFARHTLLNILTKYCVFTSDNKLLVMRPYQIRATEKIIYQIEKAKNYSLYGSIKAGGYIWHTTGSGKTLTSFKAARIASKLDFIDKVLFVVDRKDLDHQTMQEYEKYEHGSANSTKSVRQLKAHLSNPEAHIVITTIQKLSAFIKKHDTHSIYSKHVVIIFDECHRSQFGEMHRAIIKHFKKYYIFGFTGTPIMDTFPTTEQIFGARLHTYTIVNAIHDNNVLPFRVDYHNTMKEKEDIIDEYVPGIDKESAFCAEERIKLITDYIIEHYDQQTYKRRFNSILAVSSIRMAKLYYEEFKKRQDTGLKVAVIFSQSVGTDEEEGILGEENSDDPSGLDEVSRDFLTRAINDYNKMFSLSYGATPETFPNYYQNISQYMKEKKIDILIVVNMFLTGFDAQTLNTLWVDKNLKRHGLIQAFSRTNRILDSVKTFGNIICFRDMRKDVDKAISTFGDDEAGNIAFLKTFEEYYNGYDDFPGYAEMARGFMKKFPQGSDLIGESVKKDFIVSFGEILRLRNRLRGFPSFDGMDIFTDRDMQNYIGLYLDLHDKRKRGELADISDDVVFELELVGQIEINIDYILALVKKYHDTYSTDKEIYASVIRAIDASPEFRSKKRLIEMFIAEVNTTDEIYTEWRNYAAIQQEKDLEALIAEERLKPEKAREYIANAFKYGELRTTGTDIDNFMPPVSRFSGEDRAEKKRKLINKLKSYFATYFGI